MNHISCIGFSRVDRLAPRRWWHAGHSPLLTAVLLPMLSLLTASPIMATTLDELRDAWYGKSTDVVVRLREDLTSGDARTEFYADYMMGTAQCGTQDRQRQIAGVELLKQLPDRYEDLELVEIGIVYTAVRRCHDIINGRVDLAAVAARDDAWIDPQSLDEYQANKAYIQSESGSDAGAPGPGAGIGAAGTHDTSGSGGKSGAVDPTGRPEYDPNKDNYCAKPCSNTQITEGGDGGAGPHGGKPLEVVYDLITEGTNQSSVPEMLGYLGQKVKEEGLDSPTIGALYQQVGQDFAAPKADVPMGGIDSGGNRGRTPVSGHRGASTRPDVEQGRRIDGTRPNIKEVPMQDPIRIELPKTPDIDRSPAPAIERRVLERGARQPSEIGRIRRRKSQ